MSVVPAANECPCCNGTDLHIGVLSASSYGVQCNKCGLTMARTSKGGVRNVDAYLRQHDIDPDYRHSPTQRYIIATGIRTLKLAIRAWNRRKGVPFLTDPR